MFGSHNKPQSQNTVPLNSLRITNSDKGAAIPILLGLQRTRMKLLWYNDFVSTPHTHTQSTGGGKGLGGGAGSLSTTTYTYTAAMIGALCEGPVGEVEAVWDTKGKFTKTSSTENHTVAGGGGNFTPTNASTFRNDYGVYEARAYSYTVNDYGSPGPTTLTGTTNVPYNLVTSFTGAVEEYKVNVSTGVYTFPAAAAGKVVSINYTYNLQQISTYETVIVPGTPFHVTVSQSANFRSDQSVVYLSSGDALTKVTGTPVVGQYKVSAGVYTFAAADSGQLLTITYQYTDTSGGTDAPTVLSFTLFNGNKNQAVWGYLTSHHPEAAIGYSNLAYVASSAFVLGTTGEVPNYNYEVLGIGSFGAGIPDCDPTVCFQKVLSDPVFGIGFPLSSLGDMTQASNWCVANSFFISPLIENQSAVASEAGTWLEAAQIAAFWSEGQLKLAPYGDTSVVGNGRIFIPNTQPIVDLNDNDFLSDNKQGADSLKVERSPWQDAYNRVQVEWMDRLNAYNTEIVQEQNDAAIGQFGLRIENPVSYHFVTTPDAAKFAANLRVKRSVNIRNTFQFSIPFVYAYLEPMDLVTITNAELGFFKLPVRITKISDDPLKGLQITAEEFPWGTASPTLYPKEQGVGFVPTAGQVDPGITSVDIVETPDPLNSYKGRDLRIFVAGANPNWGGCDLYISSDGTTYTKFGTANSPARSGTLLTTFAAHADPDNTNTLNVTMDSALANLPPASTSDYNNLYTACALQSGTSLEIIAYHNSSLIGTNSYALTGFHRGCYYTTPATWSAGTRLLRLDQSQFTYQFDQRSYGKTIYFKACSFNQLGGHRYSLSQVTAIPVVLQGSSRGAIDADTGIFAPGAGSVPQSWAGTMTYTSTTTSITWTWNVTVYRATMPQPSQSVNTGQTSVYAGSLAVTGLVAGTNYSFYPYVDDSDGFGGVTVTFVNNTQVSAGAHGSPACAYPFSSTGYIAVTQFQGRNDHIALSDTPMQAATTSAGTGGGSGGGTGGGGCPAIEMYVREGVQAKDVQADELLDVLRGDTELIVETARVFDNEPSEQPCYRLITENGCELIVSEDTPVPTMETIQEMSMADSNIDSLINLNSFALYAKQMKVGMSVITDVGNGAEYSKLQTVEFVGVRTVCRISCGGRNFAAGKEANKRIFSHNMQIVVK